jgi:hypothetical protein
MVGDPCMVGDLFMAAGGATASAAACGESTLTGNWRNSCCLASTAGSQHDHASHGGQHRRAAAKPGPGAKTPVMTFAGFHESPD